MYPTIKAYKEEQKQPFREKSYVFVYIGVITKEAQASAYVSSNLYDISILTTNLFSNSPLEAYYGTLEQDFYKVDGSMVNIPRDSSLFGLYQGAISKDLNGSITFQFNGYKHLNIKGLTINFGEYYPTEFTVTNGNQTYSYENNQAGQFVCQHDNNDGDVFNDTSYITITPISFVNGDNKRLRILSIIFGIGLVFDNSNIMSTSRKNSIAHISDALPSKEFTFTLSNINKRFAKDNPYSVLNFLQQGQAVEFEYGRDIVVDNLLYDENGEQIETEDGEYIIGEHGEVSSEIYRIPGGITALKTWSSNDTEAKFTSVGFLDYRSEKYNKGLYYPNGRTLYDLAVDVLSDAGIENYRIDTYLKRVITTNPLPVDTHKALLQMIANASRSILYEDRYGKVVIESSFTPDVVSVTSNSYEDLSELMTVVQDVDITNYHMMDSNYNKLTGEQSLIARIFRASDGNTGYVSGVLSGDLGWFETNPTLTIEFEAQWTFFNVEITYGIVAPTGVMIYGYANDTVVNEYSFANLDATELTQLYQLEMDEVNKLVIEFTRTSPHQRIHVNHVSFGDVTDYTLTYRDMPNSPQASSLDKVLCVDTKYYVYKQDTNAETKSIVTVQAAIGTNEITLNAPSFGYSLAYKNGESGTLRIVESGAYRIKFTSSVAGQVEITGKNFTIFENTYRHQVDETGEIKTLTNELICTANQAQTVSEWIGDYFKNDVEYSINYRGEPAIDCDDLIYVENKYVNKNKIRITEESIETSTGMSMSCSLKARRISYEERS